MALEENILGAQWPFLINIRRHQKGEWGEGLKRTYLKRY